MSLGQGKINLHVGISGQSFERRSYYIGMHNDRAGFPGAGLVIGSGFPDPVGQDQCRDHRFWESRVKVHLVGGFGDLNVLGRDAGDLCDAWEPWW